MRSEAVLVLGMHRSGTSALTGVLNILGGEVGSLLMPSDPNSNPKGFWENPDIVEIHDNAMKHMGSSWHDERRFSPQWWQQDGMASFREQLEAIVRRDYGQMPLWVVKDPRMCRLMPLWGPILDAVVDETKIVLIVRHPHEVAASLMRRDGISYERSYMIWSRYMLDAEKWSRGYPRVLVTYEKLLTDWYEVIDEIASSIKLPLAHDDPLLHSKVEAFLDPGLRHHVMPQTPDPSRYFRAAESIYLAFSESMDFSRLGDVLAPLSDEVCGLEKEIYPWSSEIQSLRSEQVRIRHELDRSRACIEALESERNRIKSTYSWRVTKPLRLVANIFRFRRSNVDS